MATASNYEPLDPTASAVSPLRELLKLSVPTVLQMASYTVMQFIDTLMLSRLGEGAPAAASQGAMLSFSFISFGMGLAFMVNAFASQAYGAKNFAKCGPILWQGIWFGICYSALLSPLVFFAPQLAQTLPHTEQMRHLETIFFQWMIATSAIKLIQVALAQFMLATNRPNVVMFSAMAGVTVNAVVAYALIVVPTGLSLEAGVHRAALAQTIGVSVEALVLGTLAFAPRGARLFNAYDWKPRAREMWQLIKVGFGSGVHFVVDIIAWTVFMVYVIAVFGEKALEANAFMFRYLVTSFLPAVGVSQAVTALVGRYIGAGDTNAAARRAHLGFAVSALYLLSVAVGYFIFRRELMELFSDDPEVIRIGATLMIFCAFYQFADAVFIVYSGALRGAGDTFVPAMATAVLNYSIMVTGGYFVATRFPQYGVAGPWTMAGIYGLLIGGFMFWRFHRGKWRTKRIDDTPPDKGFDVVTTSAVAPIEP